MNLKLISLLGIISAFAMTGAYASEGGKAFSGETTTKSYKGGKSFDPEEREKRRAFKYKYKEKSGGLVMKRERYEDIPDPETQAELDELIEEVDADTPAPALTLTPAPAPMAIAISKDLVINLEIEFEDDEEEDLAPAPRAAKPTKKLNAFDMALSQMMNGHPSPTYPNPFTHVQHNYLFENKVVVLGDIGGWGKLNCGGGRIAKCPFKTEAECSIWRSKPHFRATAQTRSRSMPEDTLCVIITELRRNRHLPVDSESGQTLIPAHRAIIATGKKCCLNAMESILRSNGADDLAVQQFVQSDANIFNFSDRCLTIQPDEIAQISGGGALGDAMLTAQNQCYSGSTSVNIRKMLSPFMQLFNTAPDLQEYPLDYEFTDDRGNMSRVSITHDILLIGARLTRH